MPSKRQIEPVEINVYVIKYPIKKDLNRFFLDRYQANNFIKSITDYFSNILF